MSRKKVTQDELRALILAEVKSAGLEDKPKNLTFLSVGEQHPDGPNWTITFQGALMFSPEVDAFGAIIQRLGGEYDIEWRALH